MIIHKAEVSAGGKLYHGEVHLALVEKEDGWTYEVLSMDEDQDNLCLTWRSETPEKATEKLQSLYVVKVWNFKVIE
jgi:hypothetical protein